MMKLFYIALFVSNLSYCQLLSTDSSKVTINTPSLYTNKGNTENKSYDDLELIKNSITSLPFVKGYQYSFNLNQLDSIFSLQDIKNSIKLPTKSLFNNSIFKNKHTDIHLKSYVNMNGAAQIVTFKGGFFNDYNGDYTLQISYRLSPDDYNISIPNLIKQEVQKGLALKLKINLENGSK